MPSVIKGDSNVNLDFSTGGRITGDFSNATTANRVMFQTNETNAGTNVTAIPNGTSGSALFQALSSSSDPNNCSVASFAVNGGTDVRIAAAVKSAGSYLPMTFYTGGSERMRVDTSGNVGIGTGSPSFKLDVTGTLRSTGEARFDNAINLKTATLNQVYFDDAVAFTKNGTGERMRIDSSGNVGIGASSTNRLSLTYDGGTGAATIGPNSTGGSTYLTLGTSNAGTYAERARIDSSGNLLVGTTSFPVLGAERLGVVNSTQCFGFKMNNSSSAILGGLWSYGSAAAGGGTYIAFYNGSGGSNIGSISHSASATAYNTSSDYRLKHDIQPMTGALAKVALLKPVIYKWNVDGSAGEGFIAHELAEVCPDAVTGEKDAVDADGKPQYQGIDTSFLVATLTAAIQELKAINDAQAQTITALTARVTALEGQP